jgi:hypothetical protein
MAVGDTMISRQATDHLTVGYIIENREPSALRDITTGLLSRPGRNYPFKDFFVQILPAGQDQKVDGFDVPAEALAELTTTKDRPNEYLCWAQFTDAAGRRWEATYDPTVRRPTYALHGRGSFIPWRNCLASSSAGVPGELPDDLSRL